MTDPVRPGDRATRPEAADNDPDVDPDPGGADDAPAALKPVRGESVAAAVGSFMAGIEQQVFQRRPPAIEQVQQAQPVRGISGDGLEITISLPDPGAPER